jgi:hypothetical protein
MKLSTAIRKAACASSLEFFGGGYLVVTYHEDYTRKSNQTNYAIALQRRKEITASKALQLLGWSEEDTVMIGTVHPGGSAQELAQRCIDKSLGKGA